MITHGDILDEHGGRVWKVLGVEDDAVYIELIKIPFWDDSENISECDIILINDIHDET